VRLDRRLLCILAISAAPGAWPAAASALECGASAAQGAPPTRATLTLDPDSVTTIAYKRGTHPETLLLRFKVTGCDMPASVTAPQLVILPKEGTKTIPDDVISLKTTVPDGSEYSLTLTSNPKRFDPGSYGGFLELHAPYAVTARTPIALSRSESSQAWPVTFGVIGGIAGVVWFLLLNAAKRTDTNHFRWWHYAGAFAAATVAGILAVETAYRAQDVWTVDDNLFSALVAAFTGATTGAMASATAVLFPAPKP
jgi:hypothetical protein